MGSNFCDNKSVVKQFKYIKMHGNNLYIENNCIVNGKYCQDFILPYCKEGFQVKNGVPINRNS